MSEPYQSPESASVGPPVGPDAGSSRESTPANSSPATTAGWGPTEILLGIGLFLAFLLIGGTIATIVDPGDDQRSGTLIALQAYTAFAFIASAFFILRSHGGASPQRLGLGPSIAKRVEVRGIRMPAPLAYGLAAIAIYGLFSIFFGALLHPKQDDIPDNLGYGATSLGNVAIGLLIVIAAPVSEEIFFRGFVFAGIRSRARFAIAALISSVFWGALHFSGGDTWGAVVQLSVFGLILCWVYEGTGSIRTTIAIHAINNAIAFAYLVH